MRGSTIVLVLFFIVAAYTQSYNIDLDLQSSVRYTEFSHIKRDSIINFVQYLKSNVNKYKIAFSVASLLQKLRKGWLRQRVGQQFYDECLSIAKGTNLPVSQIIVFNYMYQLGAATDFCTAITVNTIDDSLLGRNLDYGYQQYLANNSVHLKYISKGQVQFQTLGHAGFVGTHTVFKKATAINPHQFAITLNERVDGGLHLTLQQMIQAKCETSPYALMKTIRNCEGDISKVIEQLNNFKTCAAVYWTGITREGISFVIQKNRGKGSHFIRYATNSNKVSFIVQTNHDSDVLDPDGRSVAAVQKINSKLASKGTMTSSDIWQILQQAPNFNKLTLMTGLFNVRTGQVEYKIWDNIV